MKRACSVVIACMMVLSCMAQSAKTNFAASLSGVDRISMVKNSIDIPSWHEKSFWPVYEKYMNKVEEVSMETYLAVDQLASLRETESAEEALTISQRVLESRLKEFEVRRQYYTEIGLAFNGIIAYQFLQTEVLLDMIETSRLYDQSVWRKYKFYPQAMESTQLRSSKYNVISKAINLTPDQAQAFYTTYAKYEEECDQLLGDDYSLIGFYAGNANDFTPGLAKRLGYDLLTLSQREIKLKEKYFNEMNEAVGPVLAARFLAWEDYHSLVNKMYAWSEESE